MQKSNSIKQQCHLPERKRRTQSKQNKQSPRFECFCSKQYLSYPALYLHLKNKHINYFNHNRGSRHVQNTKLLETYDQTQGYKVFKLPADSAAEMEEDGQGMEKNRKQRQENEGQQQDNILYQNFMPTYPYTFPLQYVPNNRQALRRVLDPLMLSIEVAFTIFVDTMGPISIKQKKQTELFLALFIDCLNKNYQRLNDDRTKGKQVKRYTAEYTGEYVFKMKNYFEDVYLKELKEQKVEPFYFFLTHSYLITSESYKSILRQLKDFIFESENQKQQRQRPQYQPPLEQKGPIGKEEDEDEYRPQSDSDR